MDIERQDWWKESDKYPIRWVEFINSTRLNCVEYSDGQIVMLVHFPLFDN